MLLRQRVLALGKHLHKSCQSFYDDQFWQYQGFLALIANLDDYVNVFRKRQETIFDKYEVFARNHASYTKLIQE